MEYDFSEKIVLVTGAGRGLGYSIAKAFTDHNATVAMADINKTAVEKAAQACGEKAHPYLLDVANKQSVEAVIKAIHTHLGPIHILVNNAGICSTHSFLELDESQWNRELSVNLTGAFLCMQAVVSDMIKHNIPGRIINISSLAGRNGGYLVSASYSASKAGLAGLSKAAAKQLAKYHINVNCIAPGTLQTNLISDWEPKKLANLQKNIPLGRLGTVDDVIGAVLFLASPAAGYITGVTLDINGGLYIAP